MSEVCYVGAAFDYSGYGEANRNEIRALTEAGVEVQLIAPSYVLDVADFGINGSLCTKYRVQAEEASAKIRILHTTPDQYRKYMKEGCYHIGRLFWETSRIPDIFRDSSNLMDEIWTGSETNAKAIRDSGVTVPVYVFPQSLDTETEIAKPYELSLFKGFVFYSIFEWTERKNPKALIQAFYEEFGPEEGVGLVIKTYFDSFSDKHSHYVLNELRTLKRQYGIERAPLFLYRYLMDKHQVMRFHATGDCLVSPHRGEGWGVPIAESMLNGKPAIVTNYNGISEYLSDTFCYPLEPTMVKVDGMQRNDQWYNSSQEWADVSIESIRKAMRQVFQDKKGAAKKGKAARKFIRETFNYKRVGEMLKTRLQAIEKTL